MTKTSFLDADPLFEAVSNPRLSRLARRGTLRSYRRGVVLMEEGDIGDTLLIVLAGRLKAYSAGTYFNTPLPTGTAATSGPRTPSALGASTREITYGVYGAGDLVGEMSLDNGPRSASVITVEATVCSVVTRTTVHGFIAEEPDFAFDLLSRIIGRARQATLTSRNLVLTDAYGRLVDLLVSRLGPAAADGSRTVSERLTHQDIANRIGCSREMVSRLLKDLETGGYISVGSRKHFVVHRALPARW